MQTEELMQVALKAGEIMLTSGAEIYRVEETIVRISDGYGTRSESFVLPTGIFISIQDEGGQVQTAFKRIRQRTVDLSKVEQINSFSRSLQGDPYSYEEAIELLKGIERGGESGRYGLLLRLTAALAGSFVFAVLFRGSWYDGCAAAVVGLLVYMIRESLAKKGFFLFFELFAAGLSAGFLSVLAVLLFPSLDVSKIIIGAVMLYLPGVSITNGIKDAFYGDLVASFTRLGEAFLTAAAVAAGVAISLSIGLHWR